MKRLFLLLVFLLGARIAPAADATFHGPGYTGDARSLSFAPGGDLWVGGADYLSIFGPDGTFKRQWQPARAQYNSIAFDAKGRIAIGYNLGGVGIYEKEGAQPVITISNTEFTGYEPNEIAFDSKGFLWATDALAIKKFDVSGALPTVVQTIKPTGADAFERAYSFAFDPQGRIWASDNIKNGIWIFEADGTLARRLMTDQYIRRIRSGPEGMVVVINDAVLTLDAATGAEKKRVPQPPGANSYGFTLGPKGEIWIGDFYTGEVRQLENDGKVRLVLGEDYRVKVSIPDVLVAGETVRAPYTVQYVATKSPRKAPALQWLLRPAVPLGDPDLNYANLQGHFPNPKWSQKNAQGAPALAAKLDGDAYTLAVGADTGANLLRLRLSDSTELPTGEQSFEQVVRVTPKQSAAGSVTIFVPRHRTVFARGESIELSAILRSRQPLAAGNLKFSLAPRAGENLGFAPRALDWKSVATPQSAQSGATLTFRADAGQIAPGRYLLQAQWKLGGATLRDTWPLQIVTGTPRSRFSVLFPEWAAGYTDLWGPWTGKGMREDAANLAREGIGFVDMEITHPGEGPQVRPWGELAAGVPDLMVQAAKDPGLPAPERFTLATPLEIELQETLRQNIRVQRDFWGSHFLANWGYGNPYTTAHDNRVAQLWTQYQREWPSWIGHRYLSLSIDQGDQEHPNFPAENPDRYALMQKARAEGLNPPTDAEVARAANTLQRGYISDAPYPFQSSIAAVGIDSKGNVYLGSRGMVLMCYGPDGQLKWKVPIGDGITDLEVGRDGKIYVANFFNAVIIYDAQTGKELKQWIPEGFGSGYPIKGIGIAPDGTVLLTDTIEKRVVRFSANGKLLNIVADQRNLQSPQAIAVLSDNTVVTLDPQRGGMVECKLDGSDLKFVPIETTYIAGGKPDIFAAPDDSLWATSIYNRVAHVDRNGKKLGTIGRGAFMPGGFANPTGVALNAAGNVIVSDVGLPYAQELTPQGAFVRFLGLGKSFIDVRVGGSRFAWDEPIPVLLWFLVPGQIGPQGATLQAFYRPANQTSGAWKPLKVESFGRSNARVSAPHEDGDLALRLVWDTPGATAESASHGDWKISVGKTLPDFETSRAILARQEKWKRLWADTRMGANVRWAKESDVILASGGRGPSLNIAPMNMGSTDSLSTGTYLPARRGGVWVEAENEGHDVGAQPLIGPWQVARSYEVPGLKEAWANSAMFFWDESLMARPGQTKGTPRRPQRDAVLVLGAGGTGFGSGLATSKMSPAQLAVHRKMAERLNRIGDAGTQMQLPGVGGLAILHSFTQEATDAFGDEQLWSTHAAWMDCIRAHVPCGIVSEESIVAGDLRRFSGVLLPYVRQPLPAPVLAALKQFQANGGEVWVDLLAKVDLPNTKLVKTAYRPFYWSDTFYNIYGGAGYGVGAYDGHSEYLRNRAASDERLPAVRAAWGKWAISAVQTSDADVYLQERRGGNARWVFASNDHFPKVVTATSGWLVAEAPVPATTSFALRVPAGGALYDAFAQKRVTGTSLSVAFTDAEPARIWAILPRPIARVETKASVLEGQLFVTSRIVDAAGKTIAAVVPLEVTVSAPGGALMTLQRATGADGVSRLKVPLGFGAATGAWKVTAREGLSLLAESATANVGSFAPAPLAPLNDAALSFDRTAIASWLKAQNGKEVWIALDKGQDGLQAEAQRLAQSLGARGIRAKVMQIDAIPETNFEFAPTLSDAQKATLAQLQAGTAIGVMPGQNSNRLTRQPGPNRIILRSLILLGDPKDNRWLRDIHDWQMVRRTPSPSYPGLGRALVQFAWAPFYDGFDALCISATDAGGVRAGVDAVLKLGSGN